MSEPSDRDIIAEARERIRWCDAMTNGPADELAKDARLLGVLADRLERATPSVIRPCDAIVWFRVPGEGFERRTVVRCVIGDSEASVRAYLRYYRPEIEILSVEFDPPDAIEGRGATTS